MTAEEDAFDECVSTLLAEFSTYDQMVDVVSCLESFFNHVYREQLTYFDRFPLIRNPELTPDITVLFNNNYGLTIELKRTFPLNDEGFLDDVRQLKSYDRELTLRAGEDGETEVPDIMDIVIIIQSDNANEIFKRFTRVCEENGIRFENNLIFMEFYYDSSGTISRYVLKKWAGPNRAFRDDLGEEGLESILGTQARSIRVRPEHFIEFNITRVFMNDQPPPIYMAVILWVKVLINFLSEDQREALRLGGPSKRLVLDIDVDTVLAFINEQLLKVGRVRRPWVRRGFEFLQGCGLAEVESDGRIKVQYWNVPVSSREFTSDAERKIDELREYGQRLVRLNCRGSSGVAQTDERAPDVKREGEQRSLRDYRTANSET